MMKDRKIGSPITMILTMMIAGRTIRGQQTTEPKSFPSMTGLPRVVQTKTETPAQLVS